VAPRSKASLAAFDGPSHQISPISDIFDTVMSEFVHTRPLYSPPPPKPLDAGEDIDMEVNTPHVLAARSNASWHITQEEFVSLVDLFKAHTVGFKYPTPVANRNGKVNVHTKTKVNGSTHNPLPASPSSTRELNGSLISKSASQKSPPAVSSSPAPSALEAAPHQAKKRKKSLG